jgi:type IV pilus assembly protein PilN
MIRINLLDVEKRSTKAPIAFDTSQMVTVACSLVMVVTVVLIGWWYWSLRNESLQLDAELAAGRQEVTRLQAVIAEVTELDAQRARLQERVSLIEQLRSGQSMPVQLLDHLSRSLPDTLWLTGLQQQDAQVTIEGRSTTLIALSDFVGNLADSDLLLRPIEIVDSQVVPAVGIGAQAIPELVEFTVAAQMNMPAVATEQEAEP